MCALMPPRCLSMPQQRHSNTLFGCWCCRGSDASGAAACPPPAPQAPGASFINSVCLWAQVHEKASVVLRAKTSAEEAMTVQVAQVG